MMRPVDVHRGMSVRVAVPARHPRVVEQLVPDVPAEHHVTEAVRPCTRRGNFSTDTYLPRQTPSTSTAPIFTCRTPFSSSHLRKGVHLRGLAQRL